MLTGRIGTDNLLTIAGPGLLGPGLFGLALLLSGCASEPSTGRYAQTRDSAPEQPIDVSVVKDAIPRVEPFSRYGNPPSYVVHGARYHTLKESAGYRERGIASWYGTKFHGHRTSSGEIYDMYKMSAAHKTLPLPTYARVTNLENGKSVIVKINDRGPFHENRLIDLSYAAAARLEILGKGTGLVEVAAIDPAKEQQTPARPRIAPSLPKLATAAATMKTAPSPAATVTPPAHRPLLYLQLGAFQNRDNAERLQKRLGRVDLPGELQISEATRNNQRLYRVRVGPLAGVETADRVTQLLADHGIRSPQVVID
jgi:peptidoglycan lytic transglycosylase